MKGIVSAVYDVPAGDLWPEESITHLRAEIERHDLAFEVVESLPVHEDIKLESLAGMFISSIIKKISGD